MIGIHESKESPSIPAACQNDHFSAHYRPTLTKLLQMAFRSSHFQQRPPVAKIANAKNGQLTNIFNIFYLFFYFSNVCFQHERHTHFESNAIDWTWSLNDSFSHHFYRFTIKLLFKKGLKICQNEKISPKFHWIFTKFLLNSRLKRYIFWPFLSIYHQIG